MADLNVTPPPLPMPKVRRHRTYCAVFDPTPDSCDCGSLPKIYDEDELRRYGEASFNAGRNAAVAPPPPAQSHGGSITRVCSLADIACSLGCGAGPCRREGDQQRMNAWDEAGKRIRAEDDGTTALGVLGTGEGREG